MRIAAIKNHPDEGLGYIEDILKEKGIEFIYIEAYDRTELVESDALIILGGPMGVYEADKYPYLKWEMDLISKVYAKMPVLGICLGAQLIAAALGARVYPYIKEIGCRYVEKVSEHELFANLPEKMEVFQWHGDTFDLPENAKLVYAGEEVKNQCFVAGKAIAMQFHLEMTYELIKSWLEKSKLKEDEKKRILEESKEKIKNHNKLCEKFMDNFVEFIAHR